VAQAREALPVSVARRATTGEPVNQVSPVLMARLVRENVATQGSVGLRVNVDPKEITDKTA
jgi:hypothetical protein